MDLSTFLTALRNFNCDKLARILGELNLADLIHSPWFLGGMGLLAVIALLRKWRALLALVLGSTGFAWLISYTVTQGTALENFDSQKLLVFFVGAVLILIVMLYLICIHPE